MKLKKFYYKFHVWFKYYFCELPKETISKVKDYDRLQSDYTKVLCDVTNSRMSKTNYSLDAVFSVIEDARHENYSDVWDDIAEIIVEASSTEDAIENIKKYINNH